MGINGVLSESDMRMLDSIKEERFDIKKVEKQTEYFCKIAIQSDANIIEKYKGFFKFEELSELIDFNIKDIEDQFLTKKFKEFVVKTEPLLIKYLKNLDNDIISSAIWENYRSMKYIKNQTEEIQLLALNSDPYSFEFMINPSEEVIFKALKHNGEFIKYIENPTKEMQRIAIKESWDAITNIKNLDKSFWIYGVLDFFRVFFILILLGIGYIISVASPFIIGIVFYILFLK